MKNKVKALLVLCCLLVGLVGVVPVSAKDKSVGDYFKLSQSVIDGQVGGEYKLKLVQIAGSFTKVTNTYINKKKLRYIHLSFYKKANPS